MGRVVKLCVLVVLGLVAASLQGYAAFWYLDYPGSFFSRAGLGCTAVVAVAEVFLLAMIIFKVDELQSGMVANPHSRLGRSLRGNAGHPPPPPETRAAWDGEWEDPSKAADKMRSDR